MQWSVIGVDISVLLCITEKKLFLKHTFIMLNGSKYTLSHLYQFSGQVYDFSES